jgi:DNA topoisomerase VI subunit B
MPQQLLAAQVIIGIRWHRTKQQIILYGCGYIHCTVIFGAFMRGKPTAVNRRNNHCQELYMISSA